MLSGATVANAGRMSRASAIVFLILATMAGCDDDPDLAAHRVPSSLCTTPACAAAPCTNGCVFEKKDGACAGILSATLDGDAVTACANLCGFADHAFGQALAGDERTPSGNCYHVVYPPPGVC